MATTKTKTCKELVQEKVELIKATSLMPEEVFEKVLGHIFLYAELGFSRKETWSDYLSLLGIKSYKDERYAEAKRIFNLIVKIISKECKYFNEQTETEDSKNEWKQNSEW